MNNLLNNLFGAVVVILIISFATGLLIGGPDMGKKVIVQEIKIAKIFGRCILKHLFQFLAEVFQRLAQKCGSKKKP
ncbi:MAG TPA: hypothetical protein VL335_03755 [Candidatus Paceibacterota bacterium]|nr:hypothetical protein [Candidatus Paceibacterota bacterium]